MAIAAAVPVLILVAYIAVSHGSNKPAPPEKPEKDVEIDDTDSELDGWSSRDGETSTESSDQDDNEKGRLKR